MLFNYRYIQHDIEKFQAWLDHLVKAVWCRNTGDYSLNLLHPDLKAVVEDIANDDRITIDHLDGPIKTIDAFFRQLTPQQRQQIGEWYDHNNDIEALCENDQQKSPCTYDDIEAINADLATALKAFCKSLFSSVIHLTAITSRTAEIDRHYDAFVSENDEGKCPYCGINDIDPNRREAYDHYLPKSTYPFNSVNFRNLAPMCNKCNSSYKLQKDPLMHIDPLHKKDEGTRRKAFYSYSQDDPGIVVGMTLSATDINKLSEDNINITLNAAGRDEEIQSWMDVFGIEERYKTKCCAKNDGKAWVMSIIDECANIGKSKEELIEQIERAAARSPWSDVNFLKVPFIHACKEAKII